MASTSVGVIGKNNAEQVVAGIPSPMFGGCAHHARFKSSVPSERSICKYFHPPTHLRLLVINAGKNNKRLRSEMEERYKRQRAVAGNPTMSAVAATAPLTQLHGYPASAAMDCQQGFLGYNIPGFSWNPNGK